MKQLALPIQLAESASLDNFMVGRNEQLLYFLRRFLDQRDDVQAFLWGHGARGKTHLLQAMCQQASARNLGASYLPMIELARLDVGVLDGLEHLDLLAVDDLHCVTAEPRWAEALFHLINRCRSRGCRLLLASADSPQTLPVALPDLASRLVWGPVFHIRRLADDDLLGFIMSRSRRLGLAMSAELATWMVKHLPRDIGYFQRLLVLLDKEALARKQRVTLPLLKQVMAEHPDF